MSSSRSSRSSRFRSCYDVDNCCTDFDFTCVTETLAVQSEKDSVDIRQMIERYKRDGIVPNANAPTGEEAQFLDVSDVHDYAEVMRRIRSGEEYFFNLPAEQRLQYNNDPILFMDQLRESQLEAAEGVFSGSSGSAAPVDSPESGPEKSQPAPDAGPVASGDSE